MSFRPWLLLSSLTFALSQSVLAANIDVGMSTALSGPASALGRQMRAGVESYFHHINKIGGVNGHHLQLKALDDGYEPNAAAANTRALITQNVIALIGNVGTPTAIVTVPIANAEKTLLFGAFTGAGVLRKTPPDRYVINFRASYAEETAAMIQGLLSNGIKPEEIAFFTQRDGYGDSGYQGAMQALNQHGYANPEQLAHGRYQRNTSNVEEALVEILDADIEPKAIIMVGAYKPCAEFIRLAREDLPDTRFLNVSFVGSEALKKELGELSEGVVVTQVVPHYASSMPAVTEYRNHLKAMDNTLTPSFVSLEGYLAAKVFVEGLKNAGPTPNRENLVDALESLQQQDIGIQQPISYSKSEHQASHKVWPTIIRNGQFIPLDWPDFFDTSTN